MLRRYRDVWTEVGGSPAISAFRTTWDRADTPNFTPNPTSAHKILRGLTKQQSSKQDLDDEEIR